MKFTARTGMVVVEADSDTESCGTVVAIGQDVVSISKGDLVGFWNLAATVIWKTNHASYLGIREDNIVAIIEAKELRNRNV